MKCDILILILIFSFTVINSYDQKWQTTTIKFDGKLIKLVYYQGIDPQNIASLISKVDKSTVSTTPNSGGPDGFIRSNDVIVCSKKLLMWFSLACNRTRAQ